MATDRPIKHRYNNGRDIQSDLLRALAKTRRKGAAAPTVRELQELIGPPTVSETALRDNLKVMARDRGRWLPPWVEQLGQAASGGRCWGLTDEGMQVAEHRGFIRSRPASEA